VFGKHTFSLNVGIVRTEAQAQPGLAGPIDNPTTFFLSGLVNESLGHLISL